MPGGRVHCGCACNRRLGAPAWSRAAQASPCRKRSRMKPATSARRSTPPPARGRAALGPPALLEPRRRRRRLRYRRERIQAGEINQEVNSRQLPLVFGEDPLVVVERIESTGIPPPQSGRPVREEVTELPQTAPITRVVEPQSVTKKIKKSI